MFNSERKFVQHVVRSIQVQGGLKNLGGDFLTDQEIVALAKVRYEEERHGKCRKLPMEYIAFSCPRHYLDPHVPPPMKGCLFCFKL